MDDLTVERVLRLVEAVPAGHVVSYGDIAGALGLSARLVGRIMGTWSSGSPWWRVTNHAGDLPAQHRPEAFAHWAEEDIVVKPNGLGCRIEDFRWDAGALVTAAARIDDDLAPTPAGGGEQPPEDADSPVWPTPDAAADVDLVDPVPGETGA